MLDRFMTLVLNDPCSRLDKLGGQVHAEREEDSTGRQGRGNRQWSNEGGGHRD